MFISVYSIDDEVVPPYGGEMNLYGNSLPLKKFILTSKETEHYRYVLTKNELTEATSKILYSYVH
jgi:hypothetical protein